MKLKNNEEERMIMFTKKNLKFISILSGALILFSVCPAKALDDLSGSGQSLTYTNEGTSLWTNGFGMSAGNASTLNPSTSTNIELSLTMSKYVAMAINTTAAASLVLNAPPYGTAAIPRSQFAIRSDIADLQTNAIPEFIIKGLVASNVDNVKLDYTTALTLSNGLLSINGSSGSFDVVFTGFSGTGATGYDGTAALASGGNIDTSSALGGFRLEGNVVPSSVSFDEDRAGVYTGTIALTATAM
jgi:hypothetical protein